MLDTKIPQIKQLFVLTLLVILVIDHCVLASNKQWANSGGLWGKRSAAPSQLNEPKAVPYIPQTDNFYNYMAKRTAQWQQAQGLWGKRSDPSMQQFYPAFQQYPQAV